MKPSELSRELREGHSPFLQARRTLVALSFLGVAIGKIVSLYQIGIIKKLPDPPIPIFDSNKVNASDYAYKRFATPDAFLMVLTYASTAWLAGAGREDRAEKTPLWVQLMFGKIALSHRLAVDADGAGATDVRQNRARHRHQLDAGERRVGRKQETLLLLPERDGAVDFVAAGGVAGVQKVDWKMSITQRRGEF